MKRGLLFLLLSCSYSLYSTSYDWALDMDGFWNVDANWNPNTGFPGNGMTADDATFPSGVITAPRTITLGQNIDNCALVQFTADQSYTITGGNSFTFSNVGSNQLINGVSSLADQMFNCDIVVQAAGMMPTILTVNNQAAGTKLVLGGVISGPGSSVHSASGNGTVVLSGANTYSGGTQVSPGGNLSVESGANLADGTLGGLTIFSNAVLHVTGPSFTYGDNVNLNFLGFSTQTIEVIEGATATLTGTVMGNSPIGQSSLTKTGSGTLVIAGTGTYLGTTDINAGTLSVTGTLASTTVNVNSGGTLSGTGSLQDVVVAAQGTIAPGNSPGSVQVASLSLDSSSTTVITLTPNEASSIAVAGAATLGGNIQVNQLAGTYPSSKSYTILTNPAGQQSGTFNSMILGGLPGFSFSLVDSATSVMLILNRSGSSLISLAGLSGNAARFAEYLNENVPSSAATQALAQLSDSDLQEALISASPSRNAFATYATQSTLLALGQILSTHLSDQRFYHTSESVSEGNNADWFTQGVSARLTADATDRLALSSVQDNHYSFWFDAMGEWAHQKAATQNPSFNAISGGAMLGFDFYGRPNNLAGVGAGYAYTHLTEGSNGGHEKINTYFASLYDTLYYPNWYLELALWGAYNQIHNYRHIAFPGFDQVASVTIHAWQLTPHVGGGYHTSYNWGDFEPFAQFDCVINWQDSFQEHGAGAFNMKQRSHTSEFLRSEAGFRFYECGDTSWGTWMIMEKVSYVNRKPFSTGRVQAAIAGTPALFSVETFQGVQNLGSAGLEGVCRFGDKKPFTLSLAYNGEYGAKFMSHEAILRLMKDF